ncbi:MAG: tetratricopeptide repeat protein [Sphingobacteriales bacterium]|nr:tetratricopeptide repeat protein [Sphingobacteriales bacterium]
MISLKPDYTDIYFNRGVVKEKIGDHESAILDFNKAIEYNPTLGEAYFKRGLAKDNMGDYSGACFDWSVAGELQEYGAYDLIKMYCK